jgi:anti-sigma B factor antagonist
VTEQINYEDGLFALSVREDGKVCVLALSGELDLSTNDLFKSVFDEALSNGCAGFVVDCSKLDFIDSSGITTLIYGRREAEEHLKITVAAPPDGDVRRVLDLAGIEAALPICDSVEHAVAATRA